MNILIFNDIGSLFLVFCILVNVYCSDCSTDHQKLNVVQKWAFYFLVTWGPFFLFILHFGRCLPLRLLSRSSEVEHNLKPSISFFDDLGGLFCISVDFCCLDQLADHQKLNVIQRWAFYFWWHGGPFFFLFVFQSTFITQITWPIIRSWTQSKNKHFIFWWLRGPSFIFLHFSQRSSFRSLGQSLEVEHNPKTSILFFDDMEGLFPFYFAFWSMFATQIAQPIIKSWT